LQQQRGSTGNLAMEPSRRPLQALWGVAKVATTEKRSELLADFEQTRRQNTPRKARPLSMAFPTTSSRVCNQNQPGGNQSTLGHRRAPPVTQLATGSLHIRSTIPQEPRLTSFVLDSPPSRVTVDQVANHVTVINLDSEQPVSVPSSRSGGKQWPERLPFRQK